MPVIRGALERRGTPVNLENPAVPLTSANLLPILGGPPVASGAIVTPNSSLAVPAVYACVSLIAETIGSLPLRILQTTEVPRLPNQPGPVRYWHNEVLDHPLHPLLAEQPNEEIEAEDFWRVLLAAKLLWGNGLSYKEPGPNGRTEHLWVIPPDRTIALRVPQTRQLRYYVSLNPYFDRIELGAGGQDALEADLSNPYLIFRPDEILNLKGLSLGGPVGFSPIQLARQGIGIALAAEEYGARFFGNGATPGGVLEVDKSLSEEAYKRMRTQWASLHEGVKNAQRLAVLENGATWKQITIPPEDAQFLQTRGFQVEEVCRLFGVPPHLIAAVDKTSSWGKGVEEMTRGFVTFTCRKHIVGAEAAIRRCLMRTAPDVYPNTFARWNVDSLLRADMLQRMQAAAIKRQWGFASANDILREEDKDLLPPQLGDTYLNPINFSRAGPTGPFPDPDPGIDVPAASTVANADDQEE